MMKKALLSLVFLILGALAMVPEHEAQAQACTAPDLCQAGGCGQDRKPVAGACVLNGVPTGETCCGLIQAGGGSGNPGYFNPLKFDSVEGVLAGVLGALRNIIVILSIIFIIIGAVMYILSAGNESRMNTAKAAITAAIVGMALAIAAPSFLKELAAILGWTNVVDASNSIAGAQSFTQIATKVLNFLLSIVGIIAIIMLVFGGFTYLTSAGDENRAETGKKIVTYAVIAITVALSALVLVTQVTKFFT